MDGLWTESEIIVFEGRKYLNKRATKRVAEKFNIQLKGPNMLVSKAERYVREAAEAEAEINIEEETSEAVASAEAQSQPKDPYEGLSPKAKAIAIAFAQDGDKDLSSFMTKAPFILKNAGFGPGPYKVEDLVALGKEVIGVFPSARFDEENLKFTIFKKSLQAQFSTGLIFERVGKMSPADIQLLLVEADTCKIPYSNDSMLSAIDKALTDGGYYKALGGKANETVNLIIYIRATNTELFNKFEEKFASTKFSIDERIERVRAGLAFYDPAKEVDNIDTYLEEELDRVAKGSHSASKTEWLANIIEAAYRRFPDLTEDELFTALSNVVKDKEPYKLTVLDIQSELAFRREVKGFESESGASLAKKVMSASDYYKYIDAIHDNVSPEKWEEFVKELTEAVYSKLDSLRKDIRNVEDRKKLGELLTEVKKYNQTEKDSFAALFESFVLIDFDEVIDGLNNYSVEEALASIEELIKTAISNNCYENIPSYLDGLSSADRDLVLGNVSSDLGMEPSEIEEKISLSLAVASIVKTNPKLTKDDIYDYIKIVTTAEDDKIFIQLNTFTKEEILLLHGLLKDIVPGYKVEAVEMYMKYASHGFRENPAGEDRDPELIFDEDDEEDLDEEDTYRIVKRHKPVSKETKKKALFGFITGAGIITVLHLLISHGQNPLFVIPNVVQTMKGIISHSASLEQLRVLVGDVFGYFCTIFGAHNLIKMFKKEDEIEELEGHSDDDFEEIEDADFVDLEDEEEEVVRPVKRRPIMEDDDEEDEDVATLDEDDDIPSLDDDFWEDYQSTNSKRR